MAGLDLIVKSLWRTKWLFGLWIACLCVSVTGLLVVDIFRSSLEYTLASRGRKILSGDLAISSRRRLTDHEKSLLQRNLPAASRFSETMAMYAMCAHQTAGTSISRLADLHFIDDSYPLVGELEVETSGPASSKHGSDLNLEPIAWIAPDFLTLMNVKIGDELKIGEELFRIVGVVRKDSTQTFRFGNMAPRIYIHRRFLAATLLVQFGSTFSNSVIALLPPGISPDRGGFEALFPDTTVQITTPHQLEQGPFRVLSRLLDFLGLTGLVTLCLGWVGVYYLERQWLILEAPSCGILKCLGFSSAGLRRLLLAKQTLIMSVGIFLGGFFAWIGAQSIFSLTHAALPEEFTLHWSWSNTGLLVLIGPLAAWLLLYPSVRALSEESPLALTRGVTDAPARPRHLLLFLITGALFFLITIGQARSWYVTVIFLGSLVATAGAIALISFALTWFAQRLQRSAGGWRIHLILSLWARRRTLTVLLITLSSLAGLLSQLIPHVEKTLVNDLLNSSTTERPALFLFDVQDEQLHPLEEFLKPQKIGVSQVAPFIRGRILQVNGQAYERDHDSGWVTREQETDARTRNRGVNLSYREKLGPGEKVVDGKPWSEMKLSPRTEISVEAGYAQRLKLKLGDEMLFDIQGVELKAKIASVREVDWDSFEPNFFIIFPPGALDQAPKTWVVTIRPHPTLSPSQLQIVIGQQFPSITSINVKEVLDNASKLFQQLGAGLRVASALCLSLGIFVFLLILLFQLAATQKDGMQLKVLGATRREILSLQLGSYGGLALIGGGLGLLMSLVVAWALAHFAFSTSLKVDGPMSAEIFGLSLFTTLIGLTLLGWRQSRTVKLSQMID